MFKSLMRARHFLCSQALFSWRNIMLRPCPRRGFSLIELLVVLAIIAILIGLLLPAVQKVREAAAQTQCRNNLKQMGLALHCFHDLNLQLPSGFYPSGMFTYTGWQLQLLPYLDQGSLWDQCRGYLQANPGNTDASSYPARGYVMKMFICPSNTRPLTTQYQGLTYELTSYMGNAGTSSIHPISSDGVLYSSSNISFSDIHDGTSNTIAVGERPATGDLLYGWGFAPYGNGAGDGDTVLGSHDTALALMQGDVATNVGVRQARQPNGSQQLDGAHYWSFHNGGANFLFCDGSVHFLSYSANNIFHQLCTRAGSEVFSLP
jgi:prepilin-type N-terminal cleavage/methylation domain-containing protein/prepilin-type processing-associated H-X9-DG protein